MGFLGKTMGWFGLTQSQAQSSNYKLDEFSKLDQNDDVDLAKYSAVNKYFEQLEQRSSTTGFDFHSFTDIIYGGVATDKPTRLANYRRMASFPEVSDAIDEICDDSINHDEKGRLVALILNRGDLDALAKQEIQDSFDEYISLFDFDNHMFEYMRDFVTDGEMCWENIISKNHPEYGIVNVNRLKPEVFEFAVNIKTGKTAGILVLGKDRLSQTAPTGPMPLGGTQPQPLHQYGGVQIQELANSQRVKDGEAVFLPFEQITYVTTGIYSTDGLVVYPVLEKARKAYNQLSLIEDAIIIYRLVRAPERLVFNVDCGNIPRQRAEQEVFKMMKRYQSKQVYNPVTGTVSSGYDPHQMLESYWFVKTPGSAGTEVTTLAGGQNLGELEDLNYFIRKLYISLKIPYNRYAESVAMVERIDTINREEYRFSKFVIRLQTCIAAGLLEGFKNHLRLKGFWKQHALHDRDIKIQFAPPAVYAIFEQMRMNEIQFDMYTKAVAQPELSQTLSQKKYLKWSEEEVEENFDHLEKEKIRMAEIERKVAAAVAKAEEEEGLIPGQSQGDKEGETSDWTGNEIK